MTKEQQILDLHQQGLLNKDIEQKLDISPGSAYYYLTKKNGKHANGRKASLKRIGENAECSKCFKTLPLTEFCYSKRAKYPYSYAYCRNCRKIQLKTNINKSIAHYLQHRHRTLKAYCLRKHVSYDLTKEYLVNLYTLQKGKCFYTDLELVWEQGLGCTRNTLSFDKLIPEKGYTKGNIVLCTFKANTIKSDLTMEEIKQWLPTWYLRIVNRQK